MRPSQHLNRQGPVARLEFLQAAVLCPRLSKGGRAVLARLVQHINGRSGRCNPSVKTLALGVRLSEPYVRERLVELERSGWIARGADGYFCFDWSRKPPSLRVEAINEPEASTVPADEPVTDADKDEREVSGAETIEAHEHEHDGGPVSFERLSWGNVGEPDIETPAREPMIQSPSAREDLEAFYDDVRSQGRGGLFSRRAENENELEEQRLFLERGKSYLRPLVGSKSVDQSLVDEICKMLSWMMETFEDGRKDLETNASELVTAGRTDEQPSTAIEI
jgi:hypothetical protein